MMNESRLKYIFLILSAFLLIGMMISVRHAGITCDEILHYNQSVSVCKYYSSHGDDRSALNTPVTHLKYYGQSYDNLVTLLINWFKIDDIYGFRHLMSNFAGWLTIIVTALFAVWLAGYRVGIFVIILFSVSPAFIGHSQNNLKDIPFALAYISGTYFILKFLVSKKATFHEIVFLIISIAFSLSIRAGGLILICYLFLFFFVFYLIQYLKNRVIHFSEVGTKLILISCISVSAWFLGILLWPYALQSPFRNVLESYRIMAHFPDTFRQIFEGKSEWSDFMPWYYLPKSMAITIPLIVFAGLILFTSVIWFRDKGSKRILYVFLIFTVLFPLFFVIYEKSNLYSSWRQFLFIYPAIVLLASTGFHYFIGYLRNAYLKWGIIVIIVLLLLHPAKYIINNLPYSYLYYNQLVGGLRGAYSNYETDYYYVSQTEAAGWLINYLKEEHVPGKVKVMQTYPVNWLFRDHPEIEPYWFRYEERSMSDWDYAIVANRYITPFQLKNKIWPPGNAIHIIYAGDIPVGAVIRRRSKDDYYAYKALSEGRNSEAVEYFEKVLNIDDKDEMIFYNFGAALFKEGLYQKADTILKKGLTINPDFEPILMYLGNIAVSQNKRDEAIIYYERVLKANRKYFEAYTALSELLTDSDIIKARSLLRSCIKLNPRYKPAIKMLADTYRKSDPDIAKKYDEIADTL